MFAGVGTPIIEPNVTQALPCKGFPVDRRLSPDTSSEIVDCEEKMRYQFVAVNPVQVLKLAQVFMPFAMLGVGLALALILFLMEWILFAISQAY